MKNEQLIFDDDFFSMQHDMLHGKKIVDPQELLILHISVLKIYKIELPKYRSNPYKPPK